MQAQAVEKLCALGKCYVGNVLRLRPFSFSDSVHCSLSDFTQLLVCPLISSEIIMEEKQPYFSTYVKLLVNKMCFLRAC